MTGEDYILEVPVHLLSSPLKQRTVRNLNRSHVQELKESFEKHQAKNVFNTLAVHIPNMFPMHVTKQDVLEGKYMLEVLGGNHTRQALTEVQKNVKVPSVIYTGLTNDQALAIGYEHNKKNEKSRLMTFTENVLLFRRKLHGNPDQTLSQTQRAQWKKTMADILGTTVSIQLFIHVHTH